MSAQHTPGPWIAASAPSSVVGWPVVASSGRSIASVAWSPNHWDAPPEEYAAFVAECEANSKLIGAAPKLLEALEGVVLAVNARSLRGRDHIPSMREEQGAVAFARAAIAEARGDAE